MVNVNDIFNRPPAISEDTLQYTLYLPPDQSDRVSATTLAALLTEHVQALLPDHLWHRDSFELKVAPDPEGNKDVWVLEGRMRVGDCIDDEWCAVWLLRELSSKEDVVVSVFDSDGEFLLIEAADELPSWVTPTNAENRVWIHNSRLHLLPLSHISPPSSQKRRRKYRDGDDEADIEADEDGQFITALDAVKLVRDPLTDTAAPSKVQEAVWKRISGYPAASRQHMHVTKAHLPADVAKALAVNPLLVQKAVETFYTRDALQLRAAQKMARFPPEPSVLSSVKMTRTAYAQLLGQKFHPPKVFGRWEEREGTKEWRWRDVGMKIACGFEMLYQESKNKKETVSATFDGSAASMDALKDNLRRNPDYAQYIQRLVSAGYFKGELEGSQLWTSLENQAAQAFVAARRDDDASRPSFATAAQAAINQYSDDRGLSTTEEDSDDWLNVDAADFDAMLEKTASGSKGKGKAQDAMDLDVNEEEDRVAAAQATRLRELAQKVEDFVEGKGDVDGARFADEAFSDDEGDSDDDDDEDANLRLDDDEDTEDSDSDVHMVKTEPARMTEEERAARQAAMDKLVPALDPSEYGQMPPSFHSNSQRVAPTTVETDVRDPAPDASSTASSAPTRPIRPPILPRDQYDGVDSDDESDEEDEAGADDEDDEEDNPQLVGEVEIDMAEEQAEFIDFARHALGVSDEQWQQILDERSKRGAFVPAHSFAGPKSTTPKHARGTEGRAEPVEEPTEGRLDSFEDVMRALDAELVRSRKDVPGMPQGQQHEHQQGNKGKGRVAEDEDMDIEAAMEAELGDMLERDDNADDTHDGQSMDYQLIKNFLESFKSQAGSSGPVSTLVGRLQEGWTLPRDEH